MKIFTVIALIIAIGAVIFSSQNATPVFVQFLGWQTQESMALVLLLTFALGVVFGLLISVPPMVGRMGKISQLKHKVDEQSHSLERVNGKLTEAVSQLKVLQSTPSLIRPDTSSSNHPSTT